MRAAALAALALAGCQAERLPERQSAPGSAFIAAQINDMFEKTCGISNPSLETIDAAVRRLGASHASEAGGIAFYSLRQVTDGVGTNVTLENDDGVLRCSVSSSDSGEPIEVVEHLAATIKNNGGIAAAPLKVGSGYSDCQSFRVGAALRSACTYDFTPHGISADLILTVPANNAAVS